MFKKQPRNLEKAYTMKDKTGVQAKYNVVRVQSKIARDANSVKSLVHSTQVCSF